MFCDKLSIVVPVPNNQRQQLKARLQSLVESKHAHPIYTAGYRHSVKLLTGTDTYSGPIIQCEPKHAIPSYLRIELNPQNGFGEAVHHLEALAGISWESLVQYGRITRLDLTLDAHYLHIADLLVWKPGIQRTRRFDKSGRPETIYLGAGESPRQICIYDKVAQLKKYNAEHPFLHKPVPNHPVTRVEARVKQKHLTFDDLEDLDNPFAGLGLVNFSRITADPEEGQLGRMFLLAAEGTNGQTALLRLDKATRKRFRDRIEQYPIKGWDPSVFWSQWPAVASALTNPPPPPYSLMGQGASSGLGSIGGAAS
jgi:hypothetical protein